VAPRTSTRTAPWPPRKDTWACSAFLVPGEPTSIKSWRGRRVFVGNFEKINDLLQLEFGLVDADIRPVRSRRKDWVSSLSEPTRIPFSDQTNGRGVTRPAPCYSAAAASMRPSSRMAQAGLTPSYERCPVPSLTPAAAARRQQIGGTRSRDTSAAA
jgi:hypothetical protein